MAKRLDNHYVLSSARGAVSAQEAQTLNLLPRPRPALPLRTVRTHLANRGAGVVHQAPVLRLAPRLESSRRNIWTGHHKGSFDAPERQSSHPSGFTLGGAEPRVPNAVVRSGAIHDRKPRS